MQTQAFYFFVENMGKAYLVNTNPDITWWASANKFYHLNFSDFSSKVLMQSANITLPRAPLRASTGSVQGAVPAAWAVNVDWVKAGKTTPVKDQVLARRGCTNALPHPQPF